MGRGNFEVGMSFAVHARFIYTGYPSETCILYITDLIHAYLTIYVYNTLESEPSRRIALKVVVQDQLGPVSLS